MSFFNLSVICSRVLPKTLLKLAMPRYGHKGTTMGIKSSVWSYKVVLQRVEDCGLHLRLPVPAQATLGLQR